MTDLTTLLFPTATAASSLAPAAPVSVTGAPGMAGQFAQTLGDMLAGTTPVTMPAAAPATVTGSGTVPPNPALPLPVLGLVGPLPTGKLLATGMIDRQALADDGNAVPAEPALQLLANPAWRATVVAPASPPRPPISLRTALERAAAQLATPVAAKAARGASTLPPGDAAAEEADPGSVLSDPATPDPLPAPSTLDLPASVPATLPIAMPHHDRTSDSDRKKDSPGSVIETAIDHAAGTPAAIAARAVATPAMPTRPPLPTHASADPAPATPLIDSPVRDLALFASASAQTPVPQERATALPGPQDTASPTLPATMRASRPLPTDRAILTALGALPNPARDTSAETALAPTVVGAVPEAAPQVAPTANAQGASNAAQPPAANAASAQFPATSARATATILTPEAGRAAAPTHDAPARNDIAPVRLDRSVAPPIAVTNTPQPAGQVFAAALATAATWRDRPAAERTDPAAPTPPIGLATTIGLGGTTPVQPTGDAQRAPLDLTQDSGVQRMIDHIEVLRDGADSRDTRIRLVPDALGSVDVAVRQVGERIHVSFTAEHEATRALIADAQPRLTELAAERGVRIAGTSVATDASPGGSQSATQGQGQSQTQSQSQSQPQSQSRPNAPQQPPRAAARGQRDAEPPEDQRLA
ncbi:flagellar hook-length control protein FliK [Sphingomonas echinoides]|uniref:flagellar hook-length control protein FliK n=1 Tax=Sphingomonas echinoides TaxID=59803 RepID=UPI00241356D9|nr:flagellar hook-length control protein FliK [Sphingomonas echinoides]